MTPPGRTASIGIADRLRIARDEADLGQRELAELIGASKATVTNYENRRRPTRRKAYIVKAWALATGFDYQWLLTGETDAPDGGGEQPKASSRWMRRETCADRTVVAFRLAA